MGRSPSRRRSARRNERRADRDCQFAADLYAARSERSRAARVGYRRAMQRLARRPDTHIGWCLTCSDVFTAFWSDDPGGITHGRWRNRGHASTHLLYFQQMRALRRAKRRRHW